MRDAGAFDGTAFLGLARRSKRDLYRLELFGQHLEAEETPLALLEIHGGTLLVTDARVLELRPHLDVHGAWNVKEFLGYAMQWQVPRGSVDAVERLVRPGGRPGDVEDLLRLTTSAGAVEVVISRAPKTTLEDEDFRILRDAILGAQAK